MAQYARPDSDITLNNWSDPSWSTIDEETPNDGDYTTQTGEGILEVGLSDVTDPESGSDHVIRFRAMSSGSGQPERMQCDLYENGTLRASSANESLSRTGYETFSYTLTSTEADSIGNYANLRLRFTPTCGATENTFISWAEFEIPDAAVEYIYAGDISIAILPDATIAILEKSYSGDISLALTNSVATSVEAAYSGAVSCTLSPSVTTQMEMVYSGDIGLTITVVSDYMLEMVYAGAISFSLIPASAYNLEYEYVYAGAISVSITPDAPEGIVEEIYSGQISISLVPSSVSILDRIYGGDISTSLTPNSTYSIDFIYSGIVGIAVTPQSISILDQVVDGAIGFTILPQAQSLVEMEYVGLVAISILPAGTYGLYESTTEFVYSGSLDLLLFPQAISSLEYSLSGSISMVPALASVEWLSIPALKLPVIGFQIGENMTIGVKIAGRVELEAGQEIVGG